MSTAACVTVGVATTLAAAVLLRRVRRELVLVAVDGDSMAPTYRSGERVLVRRSGRDRLLAGDVVVVERPGRGYTWDEQPLTRSVDDRRWFLKRVAAIAGDPVPDAVRATVPGHGVVPAGSVVVIGDNPRSFDSRRIGFFPADRVLGVVVRPRRDLVSPGL
ncbi:putative phage repressor [Kribbella flavida DSM 17836]|uniref:Putative phage repressor n=1 Tax=Kribbella flavida (strain DSM 17836 / JCM 10339 / NBRC 14399) TaxID=479435 RepID=D2PST3_KRIFD|nr:S26 family signal peptidase [Kribbella flavida]ADB34985.1 putative phage repressor [Kribbella flavida DSM 17836]